MIFFHGLAGAFVFLTRSVANACDVVVSVHPMSKSPKMHRMVLVTMVFLQLSSCGGKHHVPELCGV
jgi:hypothetical protein